MAESYIEKFLNDYIDIDIDKEVTNELATKTKLQVKANVHRFNENCTPKEDRIITYNITNCPGGSVSAGLAIYDDMICEKDVKVKTISSGMVASMGVIIALGGDKGLRYAYPDTEFLLHQPLIMGSGIQQTTDVLIQARHMEKIRNKLYSIIAKETGQPLEKIASDCERDFVLTAEEALEYGLIDEIIKPREDRK